MADGGAAGTEAVAEPSPATAEMQQLRQLVERKQDMELLLRGDESLSDEQRLAMLKEVLELVGRLDLWVGLVKSPAQATGWKRAR